MRTLLWVSLAALAATAVRAGGDPPVATFSIVAWDPANGDLGVAVSSKVLAVGTVVPWAEAGAGAVATQAWANPTFGPRGLKLLRDGKSAEEALKALIESDAQGPERQLAIVDAKGRVAVHTGAKCMAWAGSRAGPHHACQGNLLAGEKVVEAMDLAFKKAEGELALRLVAALEAGQAAGGDRRGKQSAAVYVARKGGGYGGLDDRYVDLRVDDHALPVQELRRLVSLKMGWERYFAAARRAQAGDAPGALAEVNRALEAHPRNAWALFLKARLHAHRKEEAAARESLEKALAADPELKGPAARDPLFEPWRETEAWKKLLGGG